MIIKNNWDLEKADPRLFSQYETYGGPFESLCQDDNNDGSVNKYIYTHYD